MVVIITPFTNAQDLLCICTIKHVIYVFLSILLLFESLLQLGQKANNLNALCECGQGFGKRGNW